MHTRTLSRITLPAVAAAALGLATCAPVDQPATTRETATRTADARPASPPVTPAGGLRGRVEAAVQHVRRRSLLTTNGFWTVFHGILGLGPSVRLLDPTTGGSMNALDYVARGGELRGLRFIPTEDGVDVQTGPMFVGQGHQDQFVAEMAQWGMPADRTFLINGRQYTFMDFVRHTQMRARVTADQELSWAALVLGQYLGTDIAWTNRAGERLCFEDVVSYELNAPVETAACGGTHRLFGLTWVYHLHLRHGGKTTGVWQGVADKAGRYQRLARRWQNADGSFSTSFFREPGDARDRQVRMNTTGHIVEWLALSLPDAELKRAWVEDAVNALALMILEVQDSPMEGGTLYHAVHGLLIYYARVYGPEKLGPNAPPVPLPPRPSAKAL
jgi:hypothetical protein